MSLDEGRRGVNELAVVARQMIAGGQLLTLRGVAERAFLSPSTVQARIGSMAALEETVARAISEDLLLTLGEDQPLVDADLRAAARQQVEGLVISNEELLFSWDVVVRSPTMRDIRDRVFAFVWPQIANEHYPDWAPHLEAAIPPLIMTGRDPESPVGNVHAALSSSYEEWLKDK